MRGISKVVGPIGLLFLGGGLFMMGYDIMKALPPLAVGGLLLGITLFDVFRWDQHK